MASVGVPRPIVVPPVALVTLAAEAGVTSADRLFEPAPQLHDIHERGCQRVNLLRGVSLRDLCESGLIAEGVRKRLPSLAHLTADWRYIANLTDALEAETALVAELRAQLAAAAKA